MTHALAPESRGLPATAVPRPRASRPALLAAAGARASPWPAAPAVLGLVLVCAVVPLGIAGQGQQPLVVLTAGALQGLALSLAVLRPRLAVAVQLLAVLVLAAAGSGMRTAALGLVLHVGLIAATQAFRVAAGAWWALALALTAAGGEDLAVLGPVSASAVVLVAVTVVRRRGHLCSALGRAAGAGPRAVEADLRELGEQRALIAREVHDVVAYSMSVVHLRAASARYRLATTSQAAEEFESLAGTARSGVSQVRAMLGALRSSAVEPEREQRAPDPCGRRSGRVSTASRARAAVLPRCRASSSGHVAPAAPAPGSSCPGPLRRPGPPLG